MVGPFFPKRSTTQGDEKNGSVNGGASYGASHRYWAVAFRFPYVTDCQDTTLVQATPLPGADPPIGNMLHWRLSGGWWFLSCRLSRRRVTFGPREMMLPSPAKSRTTWRLASPPVRRTSLVRCTWSPEGQSLGSRLMLVASTMRQLLPTARGGARRACRRVAELSTDTSSTMSVVTSTLDAKSAAAAAVANSNVRSKPLEAPLAAVHSIISVVTPVPSPGALCLVDRGELEWVKRLSAVRGQLHARWCWRQLASRPQVVVALCFVLQ